MPNILRMDDFEPSGANNGTSKANNAEDLSKETKEANALNENEEIERLEVKKKLSELQNMLNEYESLVNDPDAFIEGYFNKLKLQVEEHRARLIDQVNAEHAQEIENLRIREANSKNAA